MPLLIVFPIGADSSALRSFIRGPDPRWLRCGALSGVRGGPGRVRSTHADAYRSGSPVSALRRFPLIGATRLSTVGKWSL